jgi:hypothetical protein
VGPLYHAVQELVDEIRRGRQQTVPDRVSDDGTVAISTSAVQVAAPSTSQAEGTSTTGTLPLNPSPPPEPAPGNLSPRSPHSGGLSSSQAAVTATVSSSTSQQPRPSTSSGPGDPRVLNPRPPGSALPGRRNFTAASGAGALPGIRPSTVHGTIALKPPPAGGRKVRSEVIRSCGRSSACVLYRIPCRARPRHCFGTTLSSGSGSGLYMQPTELHLSCTSVLKLCLPESPLPYIAECGPGGQEGPGRAMAIR